MGAMTPEQIRLSNQLRGNLAEAELGTNQPNPRAESISGLIASMVRQAEGNPDSDHLMNLATQALSFLHNLQQDQSKISPQDYENRFRQQENRLRQFLGRIAQNSQDRSAIAGLRILIPQVGIELRGLYPEQQPQPAPLDQRGGGAPAQGANGAEGPDAESAQVGQLEAALKTREINNIMEVAEGIMDNADKVDFKVGGKYALVRYEKVNTNFGEQMRPVLVPENYVRWFRDRMMAIADDISPNKFDAFWTSIAIDMGFRRVNFIKMYDLANAWKLEDHVVSNGVYELEEEVKNGRPTGRPKLDKARRVIFKYNKESARQLDGLKDEITNTVTMANYIYRNDTTIRPDAGSETGFAKAFYEAAKDNDMTKNAMGFGYGHLYYLNEASTYEIERIKEAGTKERGKVGQAAQIATLLYYNLRHVDKHPNYYAYFDYAKDNVSKENHIDEKGNDTGIPTWIMTKKGKLEVDPNGVVSLPQNLSENEKKEIKLGQNIFDNILNAEVQLQMGRNKTIRIDGVKEFYGSLARQALSQELGEQIGSISDQNQKVAYEGIQKAIEAANKAGIDWLSVIDENRKADYANRIRPLIAGERDRFDTTEKGMSDQEWEDLWGTIITLPDTVVPLLGVRGNNEVKGALRKFRKDQHANDRRKFAFEILQAASIIKKPQDLNIFNSPNKSKVISDVIKNAIIDTVRAKTDMDDREDAKFAEFLNRKLWDPLMMYAPNDTDYVGFKGYAKVVNDRGYRRKSVDYRSEKNGNLFDIDDIKMLLLDPLRAWKVSDEGKEDYNRSFLMEVQGGQGYNVDLNAMKRFAFIAGTNGTEKGWASDPVGNSAKVYAVLTDPHGVDFLKDLQWGPNGEIVRGPGFKAMWEFLHDIRYSLDRGYPYDNTIDEWYQDDEGHWHITEAKTRDAMFSKAVSGLDMYNYNSLNQDKERRFEKNEAERKMGRNLFYFIMQRWMLARRVPSSGLPQLTRSQIELIEAAYKTFPTKWKNKNGRQVPVDYTLQDDEWDRIVNGFYIVDPDTGDYLRDPATGKRIKFDGIHTSQTRGHDFVENRAVQAIGGFMGYSVKSIWDLIKLFAKLDWLER